MVVDRSQRSCLLCGRTFHGRTFLCRDCADRYRGRPIPIEVRRRFYEQIDQIYPNWSNTYREYNPPRALLRFIETVPRSSRLLEIGAGGGFTSLTLLNMGFNKLVGSDLTHTTLATMRERLRTVDLVAADAESLPFGNDSFDVLLSSDVAEHLPDLDRHLGEVARVLTWGGCYLIKTPNRLLAAPYYRARGLYDSYFWHPSLSSPGEIRSLLRRHGFDACFLPVPRMTEAQLRKIPIKRLRRVASRIPLSLAPAWLHPHLEIVATLREKG